MTGRPSSYTDEIAERTAEIYALCDPDTGRVRYVGKANNAAHRYAQHLRESRYRTFPVYAWVRKLRREGKYPLLVVLETVPWSEWEAAERRAIAYHRERGRLLNVSDGGKHVHCPREICVQNAKIAVVKRAATPQIKRLNYLKQQLGIALKQGYVNDSTKQKMRSLASRRPDLFPNWLSI